jgi:hypothetical protein
MTCLTLEEIKSFAFKMYLWTAAYVSLLAISYSDVLVLFAPFS